jgi:hypothetical protein
MDDSVKDEMLVLGAGSNDAGWIVAISDEEIIETLRCANTASSSHGSDTRCE